MKKVLSLVICVAILTTMALPGMFASANSVSVWDGNPIGSYSWFVSEDVREAIVNGGTIHITDASQLAMLAYIGGKGIDLYDYTKDQLTFEGVTFILDTDIDLNNKPWSPICSHNSTQPFKGTFDGNGHTIKNMYGPSDSSEGMYADNRNPNGKKIFGLFGYMIGTVKNLKVENVNWEYDSANGASVPAGGGITAFIGTYGNGVTMGGVVDDYKAVIDNCSVENVNFSIKSTKAFSGTHGFAAIAGVLYNGSITSTYVKNFSVDVSNSEYAPTYLTSLMYCKTIKHKDGFVAGAFEVSNCFALNSKIKMKETTSPIPLMNNGITKYIVPSENYSDVEEELDYDNRIYVEDEEALREAIVTDDGAYYSEGEGKSVILRSETGITNFTFEYDGEEFVAMANLAKVADNSMLIIAIYDVDGEIKTLSDISIRPYEKDVEFNSVILADIENDSFDSDTQIAKAFIINSENAFPYVKTIEYEE